MKKKVVLAYSGGLDTSIMIRWLIDHYDCDVIALCANLGQGDELDGLEEKALKTGASKVYIEDVQDEFITDYIYPTLRAGAIYEKKYLLGTSMARPLIAKRQVAIAQKEGATMVAHGATGKGNDQVRFELTFMALDPTLTIVAPWKDPQWTLHSRDDCLAYADAHGIPVTQSKKRIYSEDRNIWHISHEGGCLEDPANEAPDDVMTWSNGLHNTPDQPEYAVITYEQGIPTTLNGQSLSPTDLLSELNRMAARHGIGHIDMVENRLVGMKSRGVYETPGGTILYESHAILEQLVLDRSTLNIKQKLAIEYADMVYDGRWFCPAKDALDAFVNHTQRVVTGSVRVKLIKGHVIPAGVSSPNSLYQPDLASFSDSDQYDQKDADGFIRLFGLPMKVNGLVHRS